MHQIEGAGHLLAAMNPEALDQAYSFLQQELQGKAQAPVESTSPAERKKRGQVQFLPKEGVRNCTCPRFFNLATAAKN